MTPYRRTIALLMVVDEATIVRPEAQVSEAVIPVVLLRAQPSANHPSAP